MSHWSNTTCVFAIWKPADAAAAAPTGGVAHGSDQAGCQTNKMKSTERRFLPPLVRLLRRDGSSDAARRGVTARRGGAVGLGLTYFEVAGGGREGCGVTPRCARSHVR